MAEALAQRGIEVVVVDREAEAGGIPRLSHHRSFGLDLHRLLRGPEYARRRVERALDAGAAIHTGVSVLGWQGDALSFTAPTGPGSINATAVILATGCRERPRSARLVPGDRPAGVLTTGQLQQLVAVGATVGRRAVVVGAEHVSYSAALTLRGAGAQVVMVTPAPRHDAYATFALAMRALRVPLVRSAEVVGILGRSRVEAVQLADGSTIECDTVVFTGGWVPDDELARAAGIDLRPGPDDHPPGRVRRRQRPPPRRAARRPVRPGCRGHGRDGHGPPPELTLRADRPADPPPRHACPAGVTHGPTLPAVTPHREAL